MSFLVKQIHEAMDAFPLEIRGEQYLKAANHVEFVVSS